MSSDAYRLYQIERVKGPGEVLWADEQAAWLVSAVSSLFVAWRGLCERSGSTT